MEKRLNTLKNALSLEWGELASELGISRSMLDHVRKGFRDFGPKTVRSLVALEAKAGIKSDTERVRELYEHNGDRQQLVREDRDQSSAKAFAPLIELFSSINKKLDDISVRLDALESKK